MERTRETQLYDVLGFRRVIARYDVLSTRHETGPRTRSHRDDRVGTAAALELVLLAVERAEVLVADDRAGLRADVLRAVPAAELTLTANNEKTARVNDPV